MISQVSLKDAKLAERLLANVLTIHLCPCVGGCATCDDAVSETVLIDGELEMGGLPAYRAHAELLVDLAAQLGVALAAHGQDPYSTLSDAAGRGWQPLLVRGAWPKRTAAIEGPGDQDDHADCCTCTWCHPVEPDSFDR